MADVNDMFNDITKEQAFYKAEPKKDIIPFTEGDYLGHITEVSTKTLDVQGKYKAQLYSYTFVVAEENKDMDYKLTEINGDKKMIKGTPYVGKKFFGKLWRFLEPKDDDKFESNSSGNSGYLRFCEVIGVECPKQTKSIDGQDVEVQLLPNLSSDDMLGQPVKALVALGKPWKDRDGKTRQYYECKFCKKWEKGKKKITGGSSDDIPF